MICEEVAGEEARKSLFKTIPFVSLNCLLLGIPLSSSLKVLHLVLYAVALLLRFCMLGLALQDDIRMVTPMISLGDFFLHCMGSITFCVLMKKRSGIVAFLSSDSSSTSKMRKIDLLWPIIFFVPFLLEYAALCTDVNVFKYYKGKFLLSALDSHRTVQRVLIQLLVVVHLVWFGMEPLCVFIYALGYCVLYNHKLNVLTSISNKWHVNNFKSILLKLQSVTQKQEQFESAFGPFLFICLCYNFVSSVLFIYFLDFIYSNRSKGDFSHAVASRFFIQLISMGLVFLISIYNEKLRKLSFQISEQLELKLTESASEKFLAVTYLQSKINKSINRPLTACKMVTVRRQVVLTIAASCVTFSVLLIQINNGSLMAKG